MSSYTYTHEKVEGVGEELGIKYVCLQSHTRPIFLANSEPHNQQIDVSEMHKTRHNQ